MNGLLEFRPVGEKPTEEGDYLLYNQCDGFHIVEASFEDGEFYGFYGFSTGFFAPDCYRAWAKLPCTTVLYDLFSVEAQTRYTLTPLGAAMLEGKK